MSIRLMTQLWDNADPELSGSRLVIMLCLADHANDDGECWPSIERIAKRARLHRQNVMVHLRELETAGYITVTRIEGRHNSYIIRATSNAIVTGNETVTGNEIITTTSNETVTTTSNDSVTTTSNDSVTGPVTPPLPESSVKHQVKHQVKHHYEDAIPDIVTPEIRSIQNAYDACGLMLTLTHQTTHLETIKRTGIAAWQTGFAEAMKTSKQNVPNYVARCAESAMLAQQKAGNNGHGNTAGQSRGFGIESLTTAADRAYHDSQTPEAIAAAQAEWDTNANKIARLTKTIGAVS
jgi:DNA-binding transcriptional ArsR family regulator